MYIAGTTHHYIKVHQFIQKNRCGGSSFFSFTNFSFFSLNAETSAPKGRKYIETARSTAGTEHCAGKLTPTCPWHVSGSCGSMRRLDLCVESEGNTVGVPKN